MIFHATNDLVGCCETLSLLGYILMNAGRPAQALPYLEQCLVSARQAGDPQCLAHALVGLGDVYLGLGRSLTQILPILEESAQIYEELGNQQGFAYTNHLKARMHMLAGEYAQAITLCHEALAINRAMGSRLDASYVLTTLAGANWFAGNRVAAGTHWEEALSFFQAAGGKAMLNEVWYGFVMVARYLLTVAGMTITQHAFDDATRLLSAVQKILDRQPPFLDAAAAENYRKMLATARLACSESTFATLWAVGQQRTLAEAVAFAATLPVASVPLDCPPWLQPTPEVAVVVRQPVASANSQPTPPPLSPHPAGLTIEASL